MDIKKLNGALNEMKGALNEVSQKLIDKVLYQIVKDVKIKDLTAIEELLRAVPERDLKAFLPDEDA